MRPSPVPSSKLPAQGTGQVETCERLTEPPRWVSDLAPVEGEGWRRLAEGMSVRLREGGRFALVSVSADGSRRLGAAGLEERALAAYRLIARHLERTGAPHPVRVWNFIPGILEPLGDLPHRYMAFNAGRYRAYQEWCQGKGAFPTVLAAGSGVGHRGEQLIVHCLASSSPGTPVENLNQIPSYLYSSRYGPFPPCFARATRVLMDGGRRMGLFVGGTASVRGEDSVQAGNFHAQAAQTLQNLSTLVAAAIRGMGGSQGDRSCGEPLGLFRSIRLYHPRVEHRPAAMRVVRESFPAVQEVEHFQTDLCRSELLVEIEGVADLGALSS